MKKIIKYSLLLALVLIIMPSCDDYLDTLPDSRTQLDDETKVINILVSAYPNQTSVMMSEFWSDNWDMYDWNLNYNNYQEDVWRWKDEVNRSGNDHLYRTWEFCYTSISACNEALAAIEKLGNPVSLKGAKAEALIARAWNHFELASLFCLPYGKTSGQDMGLPYMEAPETTVRPDYERGTVEELYKKISNDIEAALPNIDNNIYTQPKYHFNRSAAYAFATKFYMIYGKFDKAIEYATVVLGQNPASVLRDWQATIPMDASNTEQPNAYMDKNNPATLLVSVPTSGWSTVGPNNYSTCNKFSHSMAVGRYETLQSTGPWGNHNNIYVRTWWNTNTNKLFHKKIGYYFEYTDPVARTGYQHTSIVHFTTDETLLYRAEAYILTKQYAKAYEDLTTFITNYTRSKPGYDAIIDFYKGLEYYYPEFVYETDNQGNEIAVKYPTPKKELNPPLYNIEYGTDQEWLLHYVLHLRRILLVGEGQRWQDIKRYGITVYRRLIDRGFNVVEIMDTMKPDDKRRAMQIPTEITNAGCPKNPR
ncbi:MAG: RagB/SusD family nutrient uptake outer membrane protein [Prevotella sp.]|jgi:hypothetical protein|nr:RagB/SusD family nutrient uptake outer membrane protein [Prevotella sp.]